MNRGCCSRAHRRRRATRCQRHCRCPHCLRDLATRCDRRRPLPLPDCRRLHFLQRDYRRPRLRRCDCRQPRSTGRYGPTCRSRLTGRWTGCRPVRRFADVHRTHGCSTSRREPCRRTGWPLRDHDTECRRDVRRCAAMCC